MGSPHDQRLRKLHSAYNVAMYVRSLCIALGIVGFPSVAKCQCPEDAIPPGVIQLQDELGVRPLNVRVRELHLISVNSRLPQEQSKIAASFVGLCFPANKKGELGERIRDGFQRLGFFKARTLSVGVESPDNADPPTVSVTARVDVGEQYRLKEVNFIGNRAVTNPTFLRNLFSPRDYELFDVQAVRRGLENLREAYGNLGYINFSAVPETQIDDDNKLISLKVDVDEGAQFFIKSFTIKDADQQREVALRALWPAMLEPGKIYNSRLIKLFFAQIHELLPNATPDKNLTVEQNSQEGTVDIVLSTEPTIN